MSSESQAVSSVGAYLAELQQIYIASIHDIQCALLNANRDISSCSKRLPLLMTTSVQLLLQLVLVSFSRSHILEMRCWFSTSYASSYRAKISTENSITCMMCEKFYSVWILSIPVLKTLDRHLSTEESLCKSFVTPYVVPSWSSQYQVSIKSSLGQFLYSIVYSCTSESISSRPSASS